jgi:predicted dehydrogenase
LHRWEPPPAPQSTDANLPDGLLRDLDLTLWLARQQPDRVFALVRHLEDQAGLSVQVHLGFPSGTMALLDYTGWLPAGEGYQSLSVIGSAGAAYADDHQNTQLLFGGGRPQGLRTEERAGVLAAMTREFLDGLVAGTDLLTASETDWKTLLALTQAIQQSLASGLAVPLEDR